MPFPNICVFIQEFIHLQKSLLGGSRKSCTLVLSLDVSKMWPHVWLNGCCIWLRSRSSKEKWHWKIIQGRKDSRLLTSEQHEDRVVKENFLSTACDLMQEAILIQIPWYYGDRPWGNFFEDMSKRFMILKTSNLFFRMKALFLEKAWKKKLILFCSLKFLAAWENQYAWAWVS